MDLWEPRRVTTLTQARFRSSLVGLLRMLFMAGIAISAGWLIGPVIVHGFTSGNVQHADPVSGVTMINPRFSGRDDNGNTYILTAGTAKRRLDELEVVDLQLPVLEDGIGGMVEAKTGVYDRGNQMLTLEGDVHLVDASGNELLSQHALVYIAENRIVGETPLKGWGDFGEFRADKYEIIDGGKEILLTGNVWTRLQDENSTNNSSSGDVKPAPSAENAESDTQN